MSDSYQATYDAVRSRISNGDIGEAVASVAREALDVSWLKAQAQEAIGVTQSELVRPSVLMRPRLFRDGNQWCALYGENLMDGVAGFGDTPAMAMRFFDSEWESCNLVKDAAEFKTNQFMAMVHKAIQP